MKIVIAIIIFSIIILFHELGHFLLAKANGIRVNEFCLGLGPTIFGIQRGETKYSLKLLPFGGACMMEGEDEESTDDRAFGKKSVWARISVVAAGPFFNFIMAYICAVIVLCNTGYTLPVVEEVSAGYPAEAAGMQAGDKIIKINNSRIHFYKEISTYIQFNQGESIKITYERDGERYETELSPQYDEELGYYRYGIIGSQETYKGNFLENLKYSAYEVKYSVKIVLYSLRALVTGQVSANDIAGPVGIISMIGDGYEESVSVGYFIAFLQMIYTTLSLSANLGVMNLLPLPALDGGRLLFLIIEAIRGKRVDPGKEGMVHFIGMMLLFALMIVVLFNDIRKLVM